MNNSDHRVSHVTFTLPGDYKWTTTEAALKEAHDQEYELRMAFFWECQRLQEENERLRKAGDALFFNLLMAQPFVPDNGNTQSMIQSSILGWNPKYGQCDGDKEGRPNG